MTRQKIEAYHAGVGEEFITEAFQGTLAQVLEEANGRGDVAKAFVADVQARHPSVERSELARKAFGLIARVTLHGKGVESRSGGDLGFLISRPIVTAARRGRLTIERNYRRGLLCQAKLRRANGKWNNLTPNQRRILPQRIAYLSLLLYRYLDQKSLAAFQWQLCRGASVDTMRGWLKSDRFPGPVVARAIIDGVGDGRIGTDDSKILDEVVCPEGARYLEIKIDWPDDPPPMTVPVYEPAPVQSLWLVLLSGLGP